MRISDWSSDVCSSDLHMVCLDQTRAGFNAEAWTADVTLDLPDLHTGTDRRVEFFGIGFEIVGHLIFSGEGIGVEPLELQPWKAEIGRASCRERVCQYV